MKSGIYINLCIFFTALAVGIYGLSFIDLPACYDEYRAVIYYDVQSMYMMFFVLGACMLVTDISTLRDNTFSLWLLRWFLYELGLFRIIRGAFNFSCQATLNYWEAIAHGVCLVIICLLALAHYPHDDRQRHI